MSTLSFNTSAGGYSSKSTIAINRLSGQGAPLKATKEKAQRRQKAERQTAFLEKQKENLKSLKCESLDEIAHKLEMYHTYEDEIAAVKASYNNEQMFHILDEALEQGERNAKAAEKTRPKTPEEKKEELIDEALGTEGERGILSEILDKAAEKTEEMAEKIREEAMEQVKEAAELQMENANKKGI